MARKRSRRTTRNIGGRSQEVQVVLRREKGTFNPSQVFVFVDEADDSIDDGHFLVWPAPDTRWVNLPAAHHDRTGLLSFADGHVEIWNWRAPKRFSPKQQYWKMVESPEDLRDPQRFQSATLTVAQFLPWSGFNREQ